MITDSKKIDIILVSGFLGSGKTTLLNRMLAHYRNRQLGVLVNEFGGVPVDGQLIRRGNPWLNDNTDRLYEIANGSVFCSCRMSEFISGLQYFIKEKPELLFIETSGMSDFSGIHTILENHHFSGAYRFLCSLVLVDAVRFPALVNTLDVVQRQVTAADYILVSKCDLVNDMALQKVEDLVRGINPSAEIVQTVHGDFNPSLIQLANNPNYGGNLESCNTPENRPGSITLDDKLPGLDSLRYFFSRIESKVYRIKGFYAVNDDCYYVHDSPDGIVIERASHQSGDGSGLSVICPKEKEKFIRDEWEAAKKIKTHNEGENMTLLTQLSEAVQNGRMQDTIELTSKAITDDLEPSLILDEGLIAGMDVIGDKFKRNEVYVPEMLIAARAMNKALEILEPEMVKSGVESRGTLLLGTVKGDLHDIGKNLVGIMFKGAGFKVVDLGADVTVEQFVDGAREHNPDIIGLSSLLTTTMVYMEEIILGLRENNIDAKIIIGGAPVTEDFAEKINADGFADNAASAVDIGRMLIQ